MIKASFSSSMARHQGGSVRATWKEVGTEESSNDELDENMSLSAGSQKPLFAHVVIR
jgi:hypothetical protein